MIFQDASGKAGMDSRMLDIHVRLALPNVHQQKYFRFRDQIYELPVRSAADKGLPVATAVSPMEAILARASPATQRRAAGVSPLVCDSCTTWNRKVPGS